MAAKGQNLKRGTLSSQSEIGTRSRPKGPLANAAYLANPSCSLDSQPGRPGSQQRSQSDPSVRLAEAPGFGKERYGPETAPEGPVCDAIVQFADDVKAPGPKALNACGCSVAARHDKRGDPNALHDRRGCAAERADNHLRRDSSMPDPTCNFCGDAFCPRARASARPSPMAPTGSISGVRTCSVILFTGAVGQKAKPSTV